MLLRYLQKDQLLLPNQIQYQENEARDEHDCRPHSAHGKYRRQDICYNKTCEIKEPTISIELYGYLTKNSTFQGICKSFAAPPLKRSANAKNPPIKNLAL